MIRIYWCGRRALTVLGGCAQLYRASKVGDVRTVRALLADSDVLVNQANEVRGWKELVDRSGGHGRQRYGRLWEGGVGRVLTAALTDDALVGCTAGRVCAGWMDAVADSLSEGPRGGGGAAARSP